MAKKFTTADPTANAAIGNITRQNKARGPQVRRPRPIVAEFPDIFDVLHTDEIRKAVTLRAWQLAGGNAWAVTREHLLAARFDITGVTA